MNTKQFVGAFEEIMNEAPEKQELLLEQARYAAFTKMGLTGRATLYLVFALIVGFVLALSVAMLFLGYPIAIAFGVGSGVYVTFYIYRKLYRKLLKAGLANVLNS